MKINNENPIYNQINRRTLFRLPEKRNHLKLPLTEKVHLINYIKEIDPKDFESVYSLSKKWAFERGYRNALFCKKKTRNTPTIQKSCR